jgi:hypothetical protein
MGGSSAGGAGRRVKNDELIVSVAGRRVRNDEFIVSVQKYVAQDKEARLLKLYTRKVPKPSMLSMLNLPTNCCAQQATERKRMQQNKQTVIVEYNWFLAYSCSCKRVLHTFVRIIVSYHRVFYTCSA